MKSKRLLRFYFRADDFERALNNLIERYAFRSADCAKGGEYYAKKLLEIIAAKDRLSALWAYLDGVISSLSDGDRITLERYALLRGSIRRLDGCSQREIKRAVIKFARHARYVGRYEEAIAIVNEYCWVGFTF